MPKKFSAFIDKRLEESEYCRANLLPALTLAADLYDAAIRPRSYTEPEAKRGLIDKCLYAGWSEHETVRSAFEKAHRVETHIWPAHWNQEYVELTVRFYQAGMKTPFFELGGHSDIRTGEIRLRHFVHP